MAAIVNPAIEQYMAELHLNDDEQVLLDMEALAAERSFPIIGRLAGAFLEVLALSIKSRRVFEFGSGFGYSAYWFSKAVGAEGKVVCTEGDRENCRLAEHFLSRAGRLSRVEYHRGWAQDIFKEQEGDFDLIFCDVDKGDYPEVWELARTRLRKGGLYIADNCLWYGRVAMEEVVDDQVEGWTEAVKEHNRRIAEDKGFRFFINPVRDGLIAAYRL